MSTTSNNLAARTRQFVKEFPYVHTGLGIIGNTSFFVGSIFFLWESTKLAGIWLFIVGAFGMMIGSMGEALRRYERRELGI